MTQNTDFKEQISKLIQLQELDSEIFDLETRKEACPARIKEMDDSLQDKKSGMETAENELKEVQVKKNERENDIKSKEELAQKHDGELYQIKNNKEYTALQQEIGGIKADISVLEEDVINLLDSIEAAQTKCEEEKKKFEEEKQNVEKEKETIKTEQKEINARLGEAGLKRTEFTGAIDPEVFDRYEALLENKGRAALSKINDGFCGGCNMHLRPQIINEAKLKKNVVFCGNCGRMVYGED